MNQVKLLRHALVEARGVAGEAEVRANALRGRAPIQAAAMRPSAELYLLTGATLEALKAWEMRWDWKPGNTRDYQASLSLAVFHCWCRYHNEPIYDEPGRDPQRTNMPTLRTGVPQLYRRFVRTMNATVPGLRLSVSAIEKPKEARKRD